MPVAQFNHNLIKIGKRQYRNPIYLAKEWHRVLADGVYFSPAALARHLKISRARVTQILNLLHLSPEVIDVIYILGDPIKYPIITERKHRMLLALSAQQQKAGLETMLSKNRYK
jgi:hypothetical protein